MIAKRLSVAFALAAVLAVGWSPSRETAAQEPAPIALDPPAPSEAPPATEALDPAAVPSSPITEAAPSTTPLAPPPLDPAATPPSSVTDSVPPPITPNLPSLNPLTVPPGSVDSSALPPTDPSDSLPLASTPTANGSAEAPKLAAKFLLLETDWEKAKDRGRASEIASLLTSGPYALSESETTILRRGHASILSGDDARRLAEDLEALGLVRQSLASAPVGLDELKNPGLRPLTAVAATLPAEGRGGESTPHTWTFLVVAKPYPDLSAISPVLPNGGPPSESVQVSIVGWKNAKEESRAAADEAATPPKASERYVGSFIIRADQSALVPLHLPSIDGLTLVVARAVDGPSVRSLGPALPVGQVQPLHTNAGLDWEALIRAFESAPSSQTAPTIGPPPAGTDAAGALPANSPKDGYTIAVRFVSQEDLNRIVKALGESNLSVDIFATQLQGDGQGTIEIKAPADSANKLHDLAKKILPDATVQIGVHRFAPRSDDARQTPTHEQVSLSWSPATEDQAETLEKALLASGLNIGIVSVQFQGDRASMQVQTNAGSAQAVIDLVKKTLPEAEVRDEGVERLAEEEPQSDEPETASQTVAFYLKYVQASEAEKILNSLKRDDEIRIAVDERTNLLLVQAPPETKYLHIAEITELLKLLDSPPDETPARPTPSATIHRSTDIATLRTDLERVERQVKSAAAEARSLSGAERDGKVRSLRELVTEAFRLRLDLQREEAADLRDRLAKIESNLERRRRVEGAVVDRRIEVLLDPALEWPDLSLDEATPATPSISRTPSAPMSSAAPSEFGSSFSGALSLPELASGDSFSAATTLAMAIARLNDELETLTRKGAPPDSELRLALIQRQLDLLRQEFDARHQALQQELQAAKSKLRAAQTTWERISTLRDTGSVSAEEADRAQTDLETAQAEVARQEILLQQYEQAKSGLPQASVPAELDQQRPPAAQGSASPTSPSAGGWFNEDLQGTWKIVRWAARGGDLDLGTKELVWSFYGNYVQNPGGIWLFVTDESVSPMGLRLYPSEMRLDDQGPFQNTGQPLRYVYEVEGDRLRLAVRNGRGLPTEYPAELAPTDDVEYLELQRVGNASPIKPPAETAAAPPLQDAGSVPEELQGVWKAVRSVFNGKELDLGTTAGGWRLYGPYAFSQTKDSSQDLTTIYRVVVDLSSTPKRMEMHPIAMPFEDYAHIQNIKPGRYLYEVEGDRLRMAARDWKDHPENAYPAELAPGEGVHYMELERVGDADAIVPVDEGAPAGDRENWTRSTQAGGEHIESWRRDDQFAIATSLALRLAELSRRIKTLEAKPEADRDQDEVDSARASFDLLRQEFDARENAAKREFATAAESVAIAEARLQAAQKRYAARTPIEQAGPADLQSPAELANAQVSAQVARDEAKFHEALIGHYERARKTFEASSPASALSVEASTSPAAQELPANSFSAPSDPEARIVQTVPPELIGTWRLARYTVESAPEAKVTFTTWTFDETTLGMDMPKGEHRYEVVSSPDSPGTFQTYKFHELPEGLALEGSVLRVRYVVEAEGERLKVAFGGGAGPPDEVAPDQGVIYYEFDRIRRGAPAGASAPDEGSTEADTAGEESGATNAPAENAASP